MLIITTMTTIRMIRHRACSGWCVSGPSASCEAIIRAPPRHRAEDAVIFFAKSQRFRLPSQKMCQNTRSGEGRSMEYPLSPALARPPRPSSQAPDGLQDAQSCLQVGREGPLRLPRRPNKASKTAAAAPRQHQEAAKKAQEGPERTSQSASTGPIH